MWVAEKAIAKMNNINERAFFQFRKTLFYMYLHMPVLFKLCRWTSRTTWTPRRGLTKSYGISDTDTIHTNLVNCLVNGEKINEAWTTWILWGDIPLNLTNSMAPIEVLTPCPFMREFKEGRYTSRASSSSSSFSFSVLVILCPRSLSSLFNLFLISSLSSSCHYDTHHHQAPTVCHDQMCCRWW